jgi:hypothetical protein
MSIGEMVCAEGCGLHDEIPLSINEESEVLIIPANLHEVVEDLGAGRYKLACGHTRLRWLRLSAQEWLESAEVGMQYKEEKNIAQ